jgi:hypothetical protein
MGRVLRPRRRRGYCQSQWWCRTVPPAPSSSHNLRVRVGRLPITGEGGRSRTAVTRLNTRRSSTAGPHLAWCARPSPSALLRAPAAPCSGHRRRAQGTSAVLRAPAPCSGHQRRRAQGTSAVLRALRAPADPRSSTRLAGRADGGSRGLPPIVAAAACRQTDLRRSRGHIVVNSFGPAKGNWPIRRLGDGLSSTFVAERVGFEPTVP